MQSIEALTEARFKDLAGPVQKEISSFCPPQLVQIDIVYALLQGMGLQPDRPASKQGKIPTPSGFQEAAAIAFKTFIPREQLPAVDNWQVEITGFERGEGAVTFQAKKISGHAWEGVTDPIILLGQILQNGIKGGSQQDRSPYSTKYEFPPQNGQPSVQITLKYLIDRAVVVRDHHVLTGLSFTPIESDIIDAKGQLEEIRGIVAFVSTR